uniref:Uncharacterized protein n=1 Tax=Chlamydomonas euryale TaxID=1486919 RepID=A0A7R9YRH7_9CHLO
MLFVEPIRCPRPSLNDGAPSRTRGGCSFPFSDATGRAVWNHASPVSPVASPALRTARDAVSVESLAACIADVQLADARRRRFSLCSDALSGSCDIHHSASSRTSMSSESNVQHSYRMTCH